MVKPWQVGKLVENFENYIKYITDLDTKRNRTEALNLFNLTEPSIKEALGYIGETTLIKLIHENKRIAKELGATKRELDNLIKELEKDDS